MKISIVTISYNQARFLTDALLSVIRQSYDNIEFIVIDAGSTDGSQDIIERFRKDITQVILEPDDGPADGLNKGFALATGEIFGFLNSDDILEKNSLSEVNNFFHHHPEIDVVSGNATIVDEENRKKRILFSDRYSLMMAAYGASILVQPSTFFKAKIFRDVGGFNKENRIAWDSELFADMAISGARFALTKSLWSRFRVYDGSITGAWRENREHLRSNNNRIFRKIMSRDQNKLDYCGEIAARYIRKFTNMPDTIERIRNGAIYK